MLEEIFELFFPLLVFVIIPSFVGYLMSQSLINTNSYVETSISVAYGALSGFSLFIIRATLFPLHKDEATIIGAIMGVIGYFAAYYIYYRHFKKKYKLKNSFFSFSHRMAKSANGTSYSEGLEGSIEVLFDSGEELSGAGDIWFAWLISGMTYVLLASAIPWFDSFKEMFSVSQWLFNQSDEFRWSIIILVVILLVGGIAQLFSGD